MTLAPAFWSVRLPIYQTRREPITLNLITDYPPIIRRTSLDNVRFCRLAHLLGALNPEGFDNPLRLGSERGVLRRLVRHCKLPREVPHKPGVRSNLGQRDAPLWIHHEDPGQQVLAIGREAHAGGHEVPSGQDVLQNRALSISDLGGINTSRSRFEHRKLVGCCWSRKFLVLASPRNLSQLQQKEEHQHSGSRGDEKRKEILAEQKQTLCKSGSRVVLREVDEPKHKKQSTSALNNWLYNLLEELLTRANNITNHTNERDKEALITEGPLWKPH